MWSDSDTSYIGFSSNVEYSRASTDISIQTSEAVNHDKNVQAVDTKTCEVQTNEEVIEFATPGSYSEEALAAFLGRICPAVVTELDRVSRSNAFISYGLYDQGSDNEVRLLSSWHIQQPQDGVKVSEVSWNCTGSIIAVATSHTLHSSWCSHSSQLCLYNVDRDLKKASVVLDVPSCVRSVSMHPYLSSIVAAGLYSGEVMIWDTSHDNSESLLLNVARSSHDESVSKVCWTLGTGTAVTLASSALDGKLFFWKVNSKLMTYEVQERFAFNSVCVTSSKAGVTCFAFPHHNQETFVVALEGGNLIHCSTNAAIVTLGKLPKKEPGSELAKDPTVSVFESQPSSVLSLEFSPHQEHLFATASTDQAIRIYSLFETGVQRIIWTEGSLVGVTWSPSWPQVLAGWGHTGPAVTMYNYTSGEPLATYVPDNADSKVSISAAVFNIKSPKLMAVGDLSGSAHVWKIPSTAPTSKSKLL